jgi:hypothetical protein
LRQISAGELFDSILAGEASREILPSLNDLPPDDRQLLLCTVCLIREEIRANCTNRAEDIDTFLSAGCPYYIDRRRTCPLAE